MKATLEQTLCSAAIYTFERMAFLLPDIPPDEIQRRQNVEAVATIQRSRSPALRAADCRCTPARGCFRGSRRT